MKTCLLILSILASSLLFTCKTNQEPVILKSSKKEITGPFVIYGVSNATYNYNASTFTYTFTVPGNTDVKDLKVLFLISDKATITPDQNVARDYTNPVIYTVTAEDGSKQNYTVRVVKLLTGSESSEKQITDFRIDRTTVSPLISASINQSTRKITAFMPTNTDLTKLTPLITISDKAKVSPTSGVAQDFTNSVKYKVTAQDGSTQEYEVQISRLTSTSYSVPTGFGCLVERIEATNKSDACTFVYDEKGRVIAADRTYARLECTYSNTTNKLTEANITFKDFVSNHEDYLYKFNYTNGKFSSIDIKDVSRNSFDKIFIDVNEQDQIRAIRTYDGSNLSAAFCEDFTYQNSSLTKRNRCQLTAGDVSNIISEMEYNGTKTFVYNQRNDPAFIYIFSTFMRDFDIYVLQTLDQGRNPQFIRLFGYSLPTKVSYWSTGSSKPQIYAIATTEYVNNANGFPTDMTIEYAKDILTAFPEKKRVSYKITYAGCK